MVTVCVYYFRNVNFKIIFKALESRRKDKLLEQQAAALERSNSDSYLHTAVLIKRIILLSYLSDSRSHNKYVGF